MSHRPRPSNPALPEGEPLPPRIAADQRLHATLGEYRSRSASGHANAVREIKAAVGDVVDAMRSDRHPPEAVVKSLKAVLSEYPATAVIHVEAIRYGIERYYASENTGKSQAR